MKMRDANRILAGKKTPCMIGHCVTFDWDHGKILGIDRPDGAWIQITIPEYWNGEKLLALKDAEILADGLTKKLENKISNCKVYRVFEDIYNAFSVEEAK